MSKKSVLTLEDIARLANVSSSTVSRALNDSPLLNQETKNRVRKIAEEHHFRMNASARNLRLRQSRTIAFVAPASTPEFVATDDLFGMELLSGIGNGLHTLGYDLLIVHNNPCDTAWAHEYLDSGRVDGFILMTSNHEPATIKALVDMQTAFIGWGTPVPSFNYCSVSGDNIAGGTLAARHLIAIGRQHIAFLGGPQESLTVKKRLEGYQDTLLAAGQSIVPQRIAYSDYSYASGMAAMQRLMDQSPDLDGVFVNSDVMAIAAIHVIQGRGKRVPQDVAVVGYDDLPIALYNNLPLTTIRQDLRLAGKLLAQNLIQYIQEGAVTTITLPVELVVRESA